ncbi:Uncharacterised protein [Mycobacteroides abscessus subsp. abscessus]|nr:Uncharacterised protein [Mycobacteroides abscessus subsp. abscessus]
MPNCRTWYFVHEVAHIAQCHKHRMPKDVMPQYSDLTDANFLLLHYVDWQRLFHL